jgi:hypothetical protein
MKNTQFGFQTRYFDPFYKKDFGELIIVGQAKFIAKNMEPEWTFIDADIWEDVFNFDIESITWEGIDITKLYHAKCMLDDTLKDVIEKATYSHLEWVFKAEIAEHFGQTAEVEAQDQTTDLEQHIEFPTAEELQHAFTVIRNSSVAKKAA